MIHIGTQAFYEEVGSRLAACDLILAEGIDSKRASFITLPYRLAAKSRRLNLTAQQNALKLSTFKHKIVASDLDADSFLRGWSNLRLLLRVKLLLFIPSAALYLFFFVNRAKLANFILQKDTAPKEQARDEELENFARLLGGDRNRKLIRHIEQLYDTRKKEKISIGVPYGAKHMSRIVKFLVNRLGYRVIDREWLTVFDF
jgi:hypothetical protein